MLEADFQKTDTKVDYFCQGHLNQLLTNSTECYKAAPKGSAKHYHRLPTINHIVICSSKVPVHVKVSHVTAEHQFSRSYRSLIMWEGRKLSAQLEELLRLSKHY